MPDNQRDLEWADLRSAVGWVRAHPVLFAALALIAAQLAWKAQFLGHLYFRQDDFHDLDLAVEHRLTWSYLTYIGSGHLIIGLRMVAWALVRVGGTYNWALASGVTLAFVAAASLAAYRLLRDLFGERPAILIPLAIYLLTPLTLPDIGIWSSAMESVPLQLATFLALSSHLRYMRTQKALHLVGAVFWIAFGLVFFEKGLVLPLLLFAVTAAFLTERRTLHAGALASLRRYWRAWLAYLALVAAYLAVLLISLRTSATRPGVPIGMSSVLRFSWKLVRDVALPGAVGGPWNWFPVPGGSFAFADPPHLLVVLAAAVTTAVIVAAVVRRRIAWRAWAILVGWIALADILPVAIGRLNAVDVGVLGLETRYLADAAPVLVICVGLAFWPLRDQAAGQVGRGRREIAHGHVGQHAYNAVAVLLAALAFGSIWSAQAYENVTSGTSAAGYIGTAGMAVDQAPRGTPVFDIAVPGDMVEGLFGVYALQSKVIGDIRPGKLHWLRHPAGTIDGLRMFGAGGRLYLAEVSGATSLPLPAGRHCWPVRRGQVIVRLARPAPATSGILRIGYFARAPSVITVRYGAGSGSLAVEPGLHAGYLAVTGSATIVAVSGQAAGGLCVGDIQVGNFRPNPLGAVLPQGGT